MPIKTGLPSQRRMFGWFLVLSIILATFVYNSSINVSRTPIAADGGGGTGSGTPCKLDLAIAIDTSGNVKGKHNNSRTQTELEFEKYLAGRVVDYYIAQNAFVSDASKTQIGLLNIKATAEVVKPLNKDLTTYKAAIDGLPQVQPNATNIDQALTKSQTELTSSRGRTEKTKKVILVISAGQLGGTSNPVGTSTTIKTAGTDIYALHVAALSTILPQIVGAPQFDHFASDPSNNRLSRMLADITPPACPDDQVINPCKADVAVALDVSQSMGKLDGGHLTRLERARNGINALLDFYVTNDANALDEVKTHVGLITFAANPATPQSLTDKIKTGEDYRQKLTALQVRSNEGTTIGGGILEAQRDLFNGANQRANAKKVMILLTDGKETEGSHPVQKAAEAKAAGVEIFAIHIGNEANSTQLMENIASDGTTPHYFDDPNLTQIVQIFHSIAVNSCPLNLTVSVDPSKTLIRANDQLVVTYKVINGAASEARNVSIVQQLPSELVTPDGSDHFTLNVGTVPKNSQKLVRQTIKLK